MRIVFIREKEHGDMQFNSEHCNECTGSDGPLVLLGSETHTRSIDQHRLGPTHH